MLVTRIAPTPSGFLHPGNAVNFLLTSWLARAQRGRLLLRIDDMDAARVRSAYLDDIFRVVQWLGLQIDGGPGDVAEFARDYSMARRTDYYRAELDRLDWYACACSRRDLAAGAHAEDCLRLRLPLRTGRTAARVRVPPPCPVAVPGGATVDIARELGDFVVWRRDGLPAYQLASVVEDRDLGVNALVRGNDLLPSTAAQLFLAPALQAHAFAAADFRHHGLLVGPDGGKLSKSTGRQGHSMAGDAALLARIRERARGLAAEAGIEPAG